ncbi:hypothetical protein A7Q03_08575 [Eikenella sp. NML99-0057]|uniref:hypothetical protein n=1 Tax=Eikenella TaxID=538 RepID=UPI0007E1EC1A|nr:MULTISPECIES: hypothetical protein [Eikenella]OAM44409.1 hypothetical protein A7Q03_08575 [Eikenella sp. NML99-0057]
MDRAIQESYVRILNVLFEGAVRAQPNQITEEVVGMADQMFSEIGACHERLKPLAVLVDGIAGSVMKLLPNELTLLFGNVPFDKYLLSKGRDATAAEIKRLGYNKAVGLNNALKVLEAFMESWIKYSAADRKLRMCIVTAQARWRSKVEIELLGL